MENFEIHQVAVEAVFNDAVKFFKNNKNDQKKAAVIAGIAAGLQVAMNKMNEDSFFVFHQDDTVFAIDPEDGTIFKGIYCKPNEDGSHVVKFIGGGGSKTVNEAYPVFYEDDFMPVC